MLGCIVNPAFAGLQGWFVGCLHGNIWLEKEIEVFMPGFSKLHSELHDRIESVPMPDYPDLYEEMHRKVDEALISILMHKMQEIPRLTYKEMEEYPNHLK